MIAAPPQVAVGAVVVVDDHLLLVERGHPPGVGRWSLPGGRVEAGERLAAAVERELSEETGLAGRCDAFLGWVERMGDGYHFVILDFTVALTVPGRPEPVAGDDARRAEWVLLGQLDRRPLVAGLAGFLGEHGVTTGGP